MNATTCILNGEGLPRPLRMMRISRVLSSVGVLCSLSFVTLPDADGGQVDIGGPVNSGAFGTRIAMLSNGNFVVTDPN